MMKQRGPGAAEGRGRLESAYASERPRLVARLRAAGRSLEEAEDLVHDVYAEAVERLSFLGEIRNLPAYLNSVATRRLVDAWRRDRTRASKGEVDVAQETLDEIISATGLDPQEDCVRAALAEAVDDAMRALPPAQRQVIEAQVFGGLSFRQIAERTGESIDALTARKRYALKSLARALRRWIED
ncbi:MAG: sigma-70 family RNA polymerase sigma factor [Spirochaetaceae bacterium]|nr:sigma-70 family RNA polymerase sigma factor [Spirochaetaceae bacterium]